MLRGVRRCIAGIRPLWICAVFVGVGFGRLSGSAGAEDQIRDGLRIRTSHETGLATFIAPVDGRVIPVRRVRGDTSTTPTVFLNQYGSDFGVSDVAKQLVHTKTTHDGFGYTHSKYEQTHEGVKVFGGGLIVHQDSAGGVVAANGHFFPIPKSLNATPKLTADAAAQKARERIGKGDPVVERWELVVVDPGWYGDPTVGPHLAHYVILSDIAAGVREAFFLDASTGKTLDRWNLLHTAKSRTIIDDTTGLTVRAEGDPATGDFDADAAYDFSGDTYDYLFRAFGRDGIDGAGGTLFTTVHLQSTRCPNAFGSSGGTWFCDGIVTDDIIAHEFGHGLTQLTADLIYQNQPGQLNESFSDVLGEIVDLLNGDVSLPGPPGGTPWPVHGTGPGTDTPNSLRTECTAATYMTVNAPGSIAGDYLAQASFGPALTAIGTTADVVLADPIRGCDIDLPFTNGAAMTGKIVLIDRGQCFFTEKVLNAQDQGAIAVIVANNVGGGPAPMGGGDPLVAIPSVGITLADGNVVKGAAAGGTVNVTLRGNSSNEVRWLTGEDATGFGGAIRDMWQPSCMADPDTANHPFQICNPSDNGGVHSGSGIPNHAFAILTDGKVFNGYSVNPIGLFKAGAVWHRAVTNYLTWTSDFEDAYTALNQSATDLIGMTITDPRDGSAFGTFTVADAVEVDKALRAVEMNTPGACGRSEILDTGPPPARCSGALPVFSDDFESGLNGWAVSNSGPPTPYDWGQQSGGLPFGRSGTAWFVEDRSIGDCVGQDEAATHSLFSPVISTPMGLYDSHGVSFTHYVATEAFGDGGNLKISVNGGAWQLVPKEAYTFNAYNGSLNTSDTTNPMAGEVAFTGEPLVGGGWGTSVVDLTGLVLAGDTVQFRFDLGKDGCFGVDGWYLDDFEVYACPHVDCFFSGQAVLAEVLDAGDVPVTLRTQRMIGVRTSSVAPTRTQAIRVKAVALAPPFDVWNGQSMWVGPPVEYSELPGRGFDTPGPNAGENTFLSATLQCDPFWLDWQGTFGDSILWVRGEFIVPSTLQPGGGGVSAESRYAVQLVDDSCDLAVEQNFGLPTEVVSAGWGDIAELASGEARAVNDTVAVEDTVFVLQKFVAGGGAPGGLPIKARVDMLGVTTNPVETLDGKVTVNETVAILAAFGGAGYPFTPSSPALCAPAAASQPMRARTPVHLVESEGSPLK